MNITHSQDKAFWAMNFNMAANNLSTVIQHLERKFAGDLPTTGKDGAKVDGTEASDYGLLDDGIRNVTKSSVFTALKDPKNTTLAVKIMKDLIHYFPILWEIKTYKEAAHKGTDKDTKKPKKVAGSQLDTGRFAKILENFATVLYDYRNYFTHVEHGGGKIKSDPAKDIAFLDNLLNVNSRTAKERFYANDEPAMKPVRPQIGAKENRDFVCHFFVTDEQKEVVKFTEIGLAFFVSQFLEAKYVSQMLQALITQDDATRSLLQRTFAVSAIRLPRTRLTTDKELTKQSLGLDIVAELHKCPDELFGMVSPAVQSIFRFFDEDQNKENLFKRFGAERFAYLALNYLDIAEKLPTLRFHIDKGNFFYKTMPGHSLLNREVIERRLSKRVFCYKRMTDAQREYKEDREKEGTLYHIPEPGVAPQGVFRTDMLPQYKIGKESVGICLGEVNEPNLKKCIKNQKRPRSRKPDAWLSLYELPILVFLATQNKGEEAENVVKDFFATYQPLPGKTKTRTEDEKKEHLLESLRKEIDKTQRKLENFRKEMDLVYNQGGFKQGKRNKQPRFKGGGDGRLHRQRCRSPAKTAAERSIKRKEHSALG